MTRPLTPPGYRLLTEAEYERLIKAAESDDMLAWCEVCGAWLDRNDPACATTEDFEGCWKAATRDPQHDHLCRSHRAPNRSARERSKVPAEDWRDEHLRPEAAE